MVRFLYGSHGPLFDDLVPDEHGLVAVGGDLSAATLREAYSKGVFPWTGRHPIPWFSPDPRLILRPERFRLRRSLRKRAGRFEVTFDTAYARVMEACSQVHRPGQRGRSWITRNMVEAYSELHAAGVAHSVETWLDGELVGGLYGLAIGRAFFGESMFHLERDASKVALYHLCGRLAERCFRFVDCQQETEHLVSLGAELIPRTRYLEELAAATAAEEAW